MNKTKRQCGEGYVSNCGNNVPSKIFTLITKCCKKNCCKYFSLSQQSFIFDLFKSIFDLFWCGQAKNSQDTFLAGSLSLQKESVKKHKTSDPKVKREHHWQYTLKKDGENVLVCRSFLITLLKLSVKRIRIIQEKIVRGETFEEKRGTHSNRPNKLEPIVLNLVIEHLKCIPHRPSHYSQCKSCLLYTSRCV